MGAVDSPSGERDLEAIHRAQRAHEPSMEEILASIRNMIADGAVKGAPPDPPRQAAAPTREVDFSRDAARPDGASASSERLDASAPALVWRQSADDVAEPAPAAGDEEPLLSPETQEAAALSFAALSANLEVRSAEFADELVRGMLRPMLKQWLNENLPAIVERLVRAEIRRVARGRS